MAQTRIKIGFIFVFTFIVIMISNCAAMSTKGQKFASARGDDIPSDTVKKTSKLASASATATTTTEDPFSFGAEQASRFVEVIFRSPDYFSRRMSNL